MFPFKMSPHSSLNISDSSVETLSARSLRRRTTRTVTCYSDSRRGFGLDTGLTDHFNTQLETTRNHSFIANYHTLQITVTQPKSFPARSVFTNSCLVTAQTMAIPPFSCSSPLWMAGLFQMNCLHFVLFVTLRQGRHRKHRSSDAVQLSLIKNRLPSNGRCSVVCFEAVAWKRMLSQSRSLAMAASLAPEFLLWANMPHILPWASKNKNCSIKPAVCTRSGNRDKSV
jgi:hypothetical protein